MNSPHAALQEIAAYNIQLCCELLPFYEIAANQHQLLLFVKSHQIK